MQNDYWCAFLFLLMVLSIYSIKCLKCDFTKAPAQNQDDDDAIMQTRLDLTTSHVIAVSKV